MRAAREKVRVGHALHAHNRIAAAMATGALSYSKVRAITRIVTPEIEEELVQMALAGTTNHVERVVSSYRRAAPRSDDREAQQMQRRSLRVDSRTARSIHSPPGAPTTRWSWQSSPQAPQPPLPLPRSLATSSRSTPMWKRCSVVTAAARSKGMPTPTVTRSASRCRRRCGCCATAMWRRSCRTTAHRSTSPSARAREGTAASAGDGARPVLPVPRLRAPSECRRAPHPSPLPQGRQRVVEPHRPVSLPPPKGARGWVACDPDPEGTRVRGTRRAYAARPLRHPVTPPW